MYKIPRIFRFQRTVGLFVCMYVCMYVCLFVGLSVCLFVCLSVCLFVCFTSCKSPENLLAFDLGWITWGPKAVGSKIVEPLVDRTDISLVKLDYGVHHKDLVTWENQP